jgi:hypothetical protein
MRFLLSRLAFWWAALAVGLCLVLPPPQGTWVAALAVAAAGLSLALGRHARSPDASADGETDSPLGQADLLNIAAMLLRGAAHSNDLPEALHSAARILFHELGTDGLITGRLDGAGAPLLLDRFAVQTPGSAALPRDAMSEVAAEAVGSHRVAGDLRRGFAVPVLREGRAVAWMEFKALETAIAAPALLRLLDLLRVELSAVAERSVWHVAARTAAPDETRPWRDRDAANAPTLSPADTHQPMTGVVRSVLVRYPQRRGAAGAVAVLESPEVLDHLAVERLRELDPSGVNRLFERLIKAFEASATRLIPQLLEDARVGNAVGLRQAAQTLRAASASIGALTLARLCSDMESRVDADDAPDRVRRVHSMVGEIDLVLSVLRSLPAHRT